MVAGQARELEPLAFRLLHFLIEHCDHVGSKQEIMAAVWSGTARLRQRFEPCDLPVRKVLGHDSKLSIYVQTVPRVGYRLAYRKKEYRRAFNLALKLNTPDGFYQYAVLTMCYAQLGEMDAARKSLRDMLTLKSDYGQVARKLHGKWIQPDLVERLMEGLTKAGLEIADE